MKINKPAQIEEIQIQRIDSTEAFEALGSKWRALLPQTSADSAFLTWEWLYTWWVTKGDGMPGEKTPNHIQLWLLVAWEANSAGKAELAGVAPLMLERQFHYGVPMRVLRSLGGPDIDIGGFITRHDDPRVLMALCQALVRQSREWDLIMLSQFPQDSPFTRSIFSSFEELGLIRYTKEERHLYLPVQGDTWNGYLQRLPGKLRRELNRTNRRVEKAGGYTFSSYLGSEITPEHLSAVFSINEWGQYPDQYRSPQERVFQRALLETIAPLGWLHLGLLSYEERPVSFIYSLIYNHKYEGWRAGYDLAHHDMAIGKATLIHVLEDCFRRQYREFDFLRGDEYYKTRLGLSERRYYWQIWAAPRWKPLPLLLGIGIPRLKTWLKSRLRRTAGTSSAPAQTED